MDAKLPFVFFREKPHVRTQAHVSRIMIGCGEILAIKEFGAIIVGNRLRYENVWIENTQLRKEGWKVDIECLVEFLVETILWFSSMKSSIVLKDLLIYFK